MSVRTAGSSVKSQPRTRAASATVGVRQHKERQKQAVSSPTAVRKVPDSKLLQFERQGFLVTKQLLPAQQVLQVRDCVQQVIQKRRLEALKHRVRVLCPDVKDLNSIQSTKQALQLIQQQGNSDLGFLQFFNLHRSEHVIAALVKNMHLTHTAAQLLGVKRLRLYQDCVFMKEPGYAETNWHSDLRMAPLDTNAFITAWIPLRPISGGEDDSGLVFAVGSHRDFALPFWHDLQGRDLGGRGYKIADTGAMSIGDVSWHHGWTLHGAAPQPLGTQQRLALAISFLADGAKLLARNSDPSVYKHMLHDEDAESYGSWLCDLKDGAVAKHDLVPVVLPPSPSVERAPNNIPAEPMAIYYGQRATQGGLVISEGTVISEQARGYPNTPGIYTAEQVAAWRPITQAVRDKGGVFFCQLWHVGRASHPDFQPGGGAPVGPSAVPICHDFEVYTNNGGPFKYPAPRALELHEIPGIIQQFVDGAVNAIAAGFHGVELHAANGYILDQFLKDNTNLRTDEYGGSDVNKARLILETTQAVASAIGADRVGIRLCPYNTWMDATDTVDRAIEKNIYLVQELQTRVPGMAYIHMVEPRVAGGNVELEGPIEHSLKPFRSATSTPFLVAGGYQRDTAATAVSSGHADAVVFGRYFVSTPDLVQRVAIGAPFNLYNRDTFYSPGLEGYTDYPYLEDL